MLSNNITKYCFLFVLFMGALCANAQQIKWTDLSSLKDSISLFQKPILIKIETDWCGYCKMMDAKVFSHKKVVFEIGLEYYFVRLDGENKDSVNFSGRWYQPASFTIRGGVHELAMYLGGIEGHLNYPCLVVLDKNLILKKRIQGYLNRKDFIDWLQVD